VYSGAEEGDHLLMFRNPIKFANDVRAFLEGNDSSQSHVSNVSQEDAAVMRKEILRTNAAWNGVPYEIYPGGMAEPVVAEITIPAHGELPWHSHSMPSFAYVLSGEITVEDKQGNKKHFTKGQVMPETVNAAHRGIVGDQPATFIVFYARTKGMPLSGPVQ
jgi:quercetin dioxygenase-like cupin family protein